MKLLFLFRRRIVLSSLLVMSVAAAIAVSEDSQGNAVVAAIEKPKAISRSSDSLNEGSPAAFMGEDQLSSLNIRRIDSDLEPLFDISQKASAALLAPVDAAPSNPVAPPLPFRFLGRMIDEGKATLFLSMNERNIVARTGETIDDLYRVDSIENGVAEFTYLPLKQKQTLPIGERS